MEYRGLYVSATPDCEPNEGGYYCQVYADEDYGDQIDDFCIIQMSLKRMMILSTGARSISTAATDTMLRMVSSLQKTAIFNHKLNDKPKELWYSTVRNQEQISTERTQNHEDYFFRYLLYERMAGYLPVRGI